MVYFVFFLAHLFFSFALWCSRFHGMESTFSLPYIAWVSCANGWVHQVCTKWTGVTAMCFRFFFFFGGGGRGWGGSTNGPIFNLVLKIIRDCIRSVTGPENAHHSLNQSDANLKPITTWFFVCSRTRGITVGLLLFFNVYFGFYRTESCHESTTVSFTVFKCVSMHQYSVLNEVRSFLWSQLCFFPESENWQRIEPNLTAEGSEAASLSLTGISFTAIACDRLFIWGNALFFRYLWYYF